MSTQRNLKMEVDYSQEVDKWIEDIKTLSKTNLNEAFDKVFVCEKLTRLASDAISTGKLLEVSVEMCADLKDWARLNETMLTFSKKRSQLKQAVTKMVQKACLYVDKTGSEDCMLNLIECIRNVTEGKIYVEVERARISRKLAEIKESKGDIESAAAVLQELQVETYGTMEKKEKIEFILEQMRLCLAKRDTVRTQIISKKISSKSFTDGSLEPLKLKYYRLMIELDLAEKRYLSVSKHYYEVYQCQSVQDNESDRLASLNNMILYLLLAPYDNEQYDLVHRRRTMLSRDIEKLPIIESIVELFCTKEVMLWKSFCERFESPLKTDSVFMCAGGEQRWEQLHSRVVEHNIRVLAEYCTQIRVTKMAIMLDIDESSLERYLSELVVNKTVEAKIDRMMGIVHFTKSKDATETLNDWSNNINQLLSLIMKTTHLINKEKMIHQLE